MTPPNAKPPRGRGGRPPSADPLDVPLTVRLTARQYDRAFAKATRDDMSIPALTRKALAKLLDDDADD